MAKRLANGNEEDLRRIEKDRQEINAAYDNGHSSDLTESETIGNSNKSNDLADFQDRVDKYGFIHNSKLPPQLTDVELKRNNIEKLREIKWRSMIKEWPKHYFPTKQKYSDKLISRIFKGIPNSMRNVAWYKLLEIETQIKAQSGVYEKMKNFARKYSLELRQIDLDINRTFRNNCAYKKRYCQRQRQLYNVLAAYSVYNTEIGYCQGMSTLTALLLMYLSDEEQTFWALSQLMSNVKYTMHGFFKSGFPKLIRFSDKHETIIKTFLPKVHKKFIKCNITPLIYTTKWFLQCFLDALPFSLVLRIWDVYLFKGDITMLAMSYCILKMHKRTLLQKEFDMDKINEFLNHRLPENFLFDDDIVMEKLNECIEKLLRHKFENGPLLEPIPQNELPNIPFGDFKHLDKQELISKLVETNTKKNSVDEDRDEQLKQLAKDRLEIEKKRREERKKKKREEKRLLFEKNSTDLQSYLEETNGGKRIRNISDNESEDDEDSENENEDSDEDDLNPSKLSEYDDDKVDKESMLSNLTRQSSPQRSNHSFDLSNQYKHVESNLKSKNSASSSSFANQASDYENLNTTNNTSATSKSNIIKVKNDSFYSNSISKLSPKHFQQLNINAKESSASSSPTLAHHIVSPISRINSTSIPSSKSYVLSSSSTGVSNIATIKANPEYFLNLATNSTSSPERAKIVSPKMSEYVRSPHGIYTRVNVPPTNYRPMNSQLPQSTSTLIISSANHANKRTASLRSIQKSQLNQHLDLLNNNSSNNANTNYNTNSSSSFITPTKQQLQNHSLRIATIQQQQQQIPNGYTNFSIISQVPKQQMTLNQHMNRLELSPSSSSNYHRSIALNSVTNSYTQSQNQKFSNNLVKNEDDDVIEHYDYI